MAPAPDPSSLPPRAPASRAERQHRATPMPLRSRAARAFAALFLTSPRRQVQGWLVWPMRLYCASLTVWVLWAATFARLDALALTIIFLCLILVPSFLLVGARSGADPHRPSWLDWVLSSLAGASAVYFIAHIPETATRISLFDALNWHQFLFASIIIVLTLEITRRTVGLFLAVLVLSFIAYNLWGHLIDGPMGHGLITVMHFVDINVYTSDGLFGTPVRVAATYAFLFVLFGTFLERAGGGDFFFGLAAAVSGRSPGGPAKVAVVSSALFGTMSGSPTSDVVATGSITIPMMKKLGYKPALAGGVEVAASPGGSLLPPVMGSAAFIMAEVTGLSYLEIIVAALLPAVLYYVGVFLQVHLRSVALDLPPLDRDTVPSVGETLRAGWQFLIPLGGLTAMLVMGYSPTMTAVVAAGLVWIVALFRRRTRLGLSGTIDALAESAIRMIGVTGACAAAGLVVGGITMTGLASKFSYMAFALAGDTTFFILVLSAVVTIILGLGMPTPSAYVLAAVLVGPTLVNELDLPVMGAHLFLLYFAVISAMTPPVAVASYAAAAISGANPLVISVIAMRLAVTAFLMPFAFIANPGVLAPLDSLGNAVGAASVIIACIAIAVSLELGRDRARPWRRLIGPVLFATGIALILPWAGAKIIGLIALVALVGASRLGPRDAPAPASLKEKDSNAY